MRTTAAVGFSRLIDETQAATQAVTAAIDQLEGKRAIFALVFATTGYDQAQLLHAIGDRLPDTPISGCSGEGIIALSESHECDHAVGVMLISSERIQFETLIVEGYDIDSTGCGEKISRWVNSFDDAVGLLLFPDGLVGNCTRFLHSLQGSIRVPLTVSGGTSADAMAFERTYQYGSGRVINAGISAVLIRGAGHFEVAISHGCSPIGLERTVTRAENGWVFEIDDQRAWSVFQEYLDGEPEDLNGEGIVHLCVGQPLEPTDGEGYAPYVIHTPLALNKETGALFFPSGGLESGQRIRLTRRDPHRIRASAKSCAEKLAHKESLGSPAIIWQFDCAGRGRVLFGACASEQIVQPLQESLGQSTPWIGFHTYGEIGPIGPKLYYHNYTVALCALYDGSRP